MQSRFEKRKIGINALFMIPGKVGGTEIFLRNLVTQVNKDPNNDYYLFTNIENNDAFDNSENLIKVLCPIKATNRAVRILWEQVILPIQCLYLKLDVLHSPGYVGPLFTICKRVTTIFDLNYHFFPEDTGLLQNLIYKILIPLVAKSSSLIIVHSENSKKELSEILKINKNKIKVIYPGVSKEFYKKYTKSALKTFLQHQGVSYPYILSSAVSHPHKNLQALVRAYLILIQKYKIKENLVLLGFPGKDSQNLIELIKKNKLKSRVLFTGWISHTDSPYFFRGARVFVFPSLYEGFGLPLVEAMAAGAPVVASKYSCIPEVVGQGALIVDSKRPEKIAEAVIKVLRKDKVRKGLIERAKRRAQIFDWDKFGKKIIQIYQTI